MGHEVDAEALGYAKDPLAVRHMLEHLLAQPLPELDDSFLMAGWAEMPTLAGERQQIFVAAGFASHPGKAQVEVPAVEITVNHILSIRSKESVSALIAFFPVPFLVFKMVLHASKVMRLLGLARLVDITR
jgi:hypothetical protein